MLKKLNLRHIIILFVTVLINVFLVLIATIRTNYTITAKGGLVAARDILSVNDSSQNSGNYSTVYVISFNHSTIFQNFISKFVASATISEITPSYSYFTSKENQLMGEIEHNSSIMQTIICAYEFAKEYNDEIFIDYSLSSLVVNYYYAGSKFRVGDEIIAIDDVPVMDCNLNLSNGVGWLKVDLGTKLTIMRDSQKLDVIVDSELDYTYCYPYYDIDYETIKPKVTINRGYTNGPSGGLLRTLALVDDLLPVDLSKGLNIAGTGTISISGNVGAIGGIKQKLYTAIAKDVDVFFCPSANYEEALVTYDKLKKQTSMKLIEVSTLKEAIEVLLNEKI